MANAVPPMIKPTPRDKSKLREKQEKGKDLVYSTPAKELEYRSTFDGWSPEKVKCAASVADSGNLQQLSDLVETMFSDDRIGGVLDQRTYGLLGMPLSFLGGEENARKILEGPEGPIPGEFQVMCAEEELVALERWGLMLGVGLAYIHRLPRVAGQPVRFHMRTWSPRHLTYSHRAVEGSHWHVQTQTGREPVLPGAGRWVLYTPYGAIRPWMRGKWRECAFPWLLKRFALEDRANHSETLGSPVKVGTASKGSTETQRRRFLSQLQTLTKRGTLVLPEGYDFNFKEANGQTWDIYSQGQAWGDAAITISLAGQLVTTEGQAGFSEGKIFDSIKGDLIRFDAKRLGYALRSQVLEPWCRDNSYGEAPYPHWNTENPTDLEVQSRTWVQFWTSVKQGNEELRGTGKRIDMISACKIYNIPLIDVEEEATKVQLTLAPTDSAKVVKVNEARAAQGLQPVSDEENGDLFISELEKLPVESEEAPESDPAESEADPLTDEEPVVTESE
jgi:hypothetical protein